VVAAIAAETGEQLTMSLGLADASLAASGLGLQPLRPENHHRDGLDPASESTFEERAR
jgi:hypothetical protein